RETLLRRTYLRVAEAISDRQVPLGQRDDLVLANSKWSAAQLAEHFGVMESPVLYPPVVLPTAPTNSKRDPLGFVCLGRIVPEKEVERIIRILERVRKEGYAVNLRLIGELDETPYGSRIGSLIDRHDWIRPEGFLQLEAKQEILASQTYALHACRIEAFGIAVAEMASLGCVPIVPDSGGAREIVPPEELHFGSDEEACAKIIRLLKRPELLPALREELSLGVSRFGPEVFQRELRSHLRQFAGLKKPSPHADSEKNLATSL
ncbi:MAG: glycosyltransferase family 4 protein, partial [Verrucomicrobiota bacterium]